MAKMEWDAEIVMTTTPRHAAAGALRVLWEIIRHPRSETVEWRQGVHFDTRPSVNPDTPKDSA